jgi:copper chaperone CopZ
MELGPIQQLREYGWNLLADDPGTIVGDRDPDAAVVAFDPDRVTVEQMIEAVNQAGFRASMKP